eukprot:CAMPEP_0197522398 /NCGR_PEP_ID=MMETSP1318-20131121/7562_1 /TAXON_ID=552666 /ORGANISM="Partenskyella glossopodia, Strain RCC365" /LENGTH=353 /DNA_ID=CAMNT_0043074777 /DNA_START=25 /DNA_END=1087 /DNA_ORIENTATION=-
MVEAKADINAVDRQGLTIFDWALDSLQFDKLNYLVKNYPLPHKQLRIKPKPFGKCNTDLQRECTRLIHAKVGHTTDISGGLEAVRIPAAQEDNNHNQSLPFFRYACEPEFHKSVHQKIGTQKIFDEHIRQTRRHPTKYISLDGSLLSHSCEKSEVCRCDEIIPEKHRTAAKEHGVNIDMRLVYFAEKGWGVVTNEFVSKGQFISVYIGELISQREKLDREKLQPASGLTYIIDSQIGPKWTHQVIDATHVGNVARFYNHSCDPNIASKLVYNRRYDRPLLSFFASRDILKGEELAGAIRLNPTLGLSAAAGRKNAADTSDTTPETTPEQQRNIQQPTTSNNIFLYRAFDCLIV